MNTESTTNPKNFKVYLIGSGVAGLASAVYLERDAGIPGGNIHILEKDSIVGGATDGAGDKDKGFVVRGGRMHEMHYECYWELLSHIPSREVPDISVRDESFGFNERFASNGQARLLKDGKKLPRSPENRIVFWRPFSISSRTMQAEPRMWPASMNVTRIPGASSSIWL